MNPNPTCEHRDAVLWFARLEQAVSRGDFAGAQRATEQLRQLGVIVRFCRLRPLPPRPPGGGHVA